MNGGADDDQVFGFTGNDLVFGGSGNDEVNGGSGNDLVFGGTGNDKIIGFGVSVLSSQSEPGKGEVDTLIGNLGNDTFVLGTVLPNGTESVIYNDSDTAAGTDDYALIADFGIVGSGLESGEDIIQLIGSATNYSLSASPIGLPSGTGIFYNDGTTPELISIVAEILPSDLSLSNPNQFTFI